MPATREAAPADSAPSLAARILAFASIIAAGACGGLIGFTVTDISCDNGCAVGAGLVGLLAAVGAAAGTAVVAVLMLRSSAEWRARPPAAIAGSAAPGAGGRLRRRGRRG